MNQPTPPTSRGEPSARGPTLTDAQGMGGVNALDGFDYQVWDGLIRLPRWLRNAAFEGMAFETLEDLEARFFAPHAPLQHVLDRFQAKSGQQSRAELVKVFTSFRQFDAAHPQAARSHTLVTQSLPSTLQWLAADPDRVRNARPFYHPFADVRQASDGKLRADLINELGAELGAHFADRVQVALVPLPDRATAVSRFSAALHAAFPSLDVGQRKVEAGFTRLADLAFRRRGQLLSRRELLAELRATLECELMSDDVLPVRVRSDRNGALDDAVEIDAARFSGGDTPLPDTEAWRRDLQCPLEATARWASANGVRRIALSGQFRLSTAFVLGQAFRSVGGFEIDIPVRDGTWPTDDRTESSVPADVRITPLTASIGGRLVVSIGILRDSSADVRHHCGHDRVMTLSLDRPIVSAALAQAVTSALKRAIDEHAKSHRAVAIDLFYLGPASLGVALGHRWNGMPPTRLFEWSNAVGDYVPTALLR